MKRVCMAALAVVAMVSGGYGHAQEAPSGEQHNHQGITLLDGTLTPFRHDDRRASGYFTIRNDDEVDHLLKGVSSPACSSVGAHHTNQEQTQATNDLFLHLAVPHKATMIFPPSGYHLVCNGLKTPLKPGESVPFTFSFLGGDSITLGFNVRAAD